MGIECRWVVGAEKSLEDVGYLFFFFGSGMVSVMSTGFFFFFSFIWQIS